MSDYDLTTWLGPAADELTEEQTERVHAVARWADERWPGEDGQEDRDTALSAAVQYLLGETTPADAGHALVALRRAERAASIAAQALAILACEDGMSEVQAAETLALDRMTVRKARGK